MNPVLDALCDNSIKKKTQMVYIADAIPQYLVVMSAIQTKSTAGI